MKIYDLSHTITSSMPVYPGTEPPVIIDACTHEKDSFLEKKLSLYSHTGTHLDVPVHLFPGKKTLDDLPVAQFLGTAVAIDVRHHCQIEINDLHPYTNVISQIDFCLLYTGWTQHWGTDQYFSDYPVLSPSTANWLLNYPLKGLGVDTISVDAVGTDMPVHKALLNNDIIIIENLKNLQLLAGQIFEFMCMPLKIQGGDGSPVRAIAICR